MKIEKNNTKWNAFLSTVTGWISELLIFVKVFVYRCLNISKFEGFSRAGTLFLRSFKVAGLTALVAGALSQQAPGAFIQVGEDLGGFAFDTAEKYVIVPFELENNDQGTQYLQFDVNSFKPLFDTILHFGNNSTEYATLDDMLQGNHYDSNQRNFGLSLDSGVDYVSSGWTPSLNANGEMNVQEIFQTEGEPWGYNSNVNDHNHTVRGVLSIYAGLLSSTGNSADYVFGDMSTGLQLQMSENTFFEDFGQASGVATTTGGSNIPTNLGPDARYVTAVIPEPGTIGLVGVGLLTALAASKLGKKKENPVYEPKVGPAPYEK